MYRSQWVDTAYRGDAEAQYRLGVSYCYELTPLYHTGIATAWLCRASIQGHSKAQYQLANIFVGRVMQQGNANTRGQDNTNTDAFGLYTLTEQKRHPEAGRVRDWLKCPCNPMKLFWGNNAQNSGPNRIAARCRIAIPLCRAMNATITITNPTFLIGKL